MTTKKNAEAKTDKKSLIGTDPLEWLEEEGSQGNKQIIELGESLNIRELEALHQSLLSSIDTAEEIILDASQVQKADAVSLQLLAAFYQSSSSNNTNVTWSGWSDAFKESSELLGLSDTLGITSVS